MSQTTEDARFTRDGAVSVAGMQMAHDLRDADAAPVTMADANAWAVNNRMKPTGNDAKDLASINRMRGLLKLPRFTIIPERGVREALPAPTVREMASSKPLKVKEVIMPEPITIEPSGEISEPKKVERSLRGLSDALFDEIDELRAGRGSADKIKAVCTLSVRITELLATELKFRKLASETSDGSEKTRLLEITG